jgi:hypothetical protein
MAAISRLRLHWPREQGDTLIEIEAISKNFYRNNLHSEGRFLEYETVIRISDGINAEDPPTQPKTREESSFSFGVVIANYVPAGIHLHVTLKADLSKIDEKKLKKIFGKDRKKYYVINYEIRTNFFSAHTEYSLWFKDECYGKVNAKYE